MAKVALLVGVGDYQFELNLLSAATRDVQAVERVLRQPDIGGFGRDDVTTLLNPEPQRLREAINRLFADRCKDDLLVLYFSGHGVVDNSGTLHLACSQTQKGLLESTAIPAYSVHRLMEACRSKQQVVILDCCFSGAFARGMAAKGDAVNLMEQLGGQGRVVLTSSSAVEYSFEQKESELSVYTRYLVEGLETGAADRDSNGWITADELYDYASRKVREAAPAMNPKIYAAEDGYNIILSKAPVGDPALEYRKELERLATERQGKFSKIVLIGLEAKRQRWGVSPETATAIQAEVLEPFRQLEEKLQQYEQVLLEAYEHESPLSASTRDDLQYLQQALGLRDQDIAPIEMKCAQQSHTVSTMSSEEFFNQATDKAKQGDYQGAIADYDQAIKLKPDDADAYINRGNARFELGDKQGAIADYDQAIKLKPDDADAYFNRGNARSNLGDKQGAINDYNESIQLNNPKLWSPYNNRGLARAALDDKQGAIADYDQAIKLKPDDAIVYVNRGTVRSELGDKQGAIADYDQAIFLKPDFATAYVNRGATRFDLGNMPGAIKDFDQAVKLKPDFADAYYVRGFARSVLGNMQGALKNYQTAAKLYQEQGKTQDYQKTLEQIEGLQSVRRRVVAKDEG